MMVERKSLELFTKVVELLQKQGFVHKNSSCAGNTYRYGPAGQLLKKNILGIWWNWMVITQEKAYPVENSVYKEGTERKKISLRENLSEGCLQHFPEVSVLAHKRLPFSIVQTGVCFPKLTQSVSEEKFLYDSIIHTCLTSQRYCNPSSVVQEFDHLVAYRLQWWRKYAENPSDFSESELQSLDDGTSLVDIQYEFPWGVDSIETVVNRGDKPLQDLQKSSGEDLQCLQNGKDVLPCVVECNTILERGMLAYLVDAYIEREPFTLNKEPDKTTNKRKLLHLHASFAPYDASIATSEKMTRDMRVVIEHISKTLREVGITTVDVSTVDSTLQQQFLRNDELGIPFTVVIDTMTTETGLVKIRHRDTTLKEVIHVTGIKNFLLMQINTDES